jgi:uncharacterized protein YndB with AHSA1/START domain
VTGRDPVGIEASRTFAVDRDVAFDYVTEPKNWPHFWPDLVEILDLEQARWQQPGDTMRLRMRMAGRLTELQMTLDEIRRPELVRYRSVQPRLPPVAHERHFEAAGGGCRYRLVVSYPPRAGAAGLVDRTLVRFATRRALRRTLSNLARRWPDAGDLVRRA